MIINLKNSKNLSTNDLRNSYQVQWWYIHEFYTDSLSFAVLSLVNSSLEQTHRDNIAYYLGSQYISYLEKCVLWVRISFLWRFTTKNNNYQSCLVCHKAITLLKCKKKTTCINSLKFLGIALKMSTKGTTLVNTRNLTTTATATAQLQYIVNELNQDVQYFSSRG